MIKFSKRETGAFATVVGVAVVGGTGWLIQNQRQQMVTADLKPAFADGTPAKTAGPDGTAEITAARAEESTTSPSPTASSAPKAPSTKSDQIVVFVSGAVKRPGVYTFKPGARIYHAVRAAGGFKVNAQQDALNQAETLRDADQIYIPPRSKAPNSDTASVATANGNTAGTHTEMFRGSSARRISFPPPTVTVRPLIIEGTTPSAAGGGSPVTSIDPPRERGRVLGKPPVESVAVAAETSEPTVIGTSGTEGAVLNTESAAESAKSAGRSHGRSNGAATKFKNPGDGVVNINTADLAELQKLPGVGPSTAQKFIEYRTWIGRFASTEQIQDIKGIGPKKYAKLKPFIRL